MHKKQLMHHKPAYANGQLLLADDFIREQEYHAHARYRHSRNFHGMGVLRGLEVSRASDTSISVSPGLAIDGRGREIELLKGELLDLQGMPASTQMSVTLGYDTERRDKDQERDKQIECCAVLRVSGGIDENAIVLATVLLDDHARLGPNAIGIATRRVLRTPIAPGSVSAAALDDSLRTGWLRMPFRPTIIPQDSTGAPSPPPFRVGPTEAVAHKEIDKQPNTRGAGGTMAIVLPPQVTHIHSLRVAGTANEKKISIKLVKGFWDEENMKHVPTTLIERKVERAPYDEKYKIPDEHSFVDPECSTLSLELRSEAYAQVSLIAVKVSY